MKPLSRTPALVAMAAALIAVGAASLASAADGKFAGKMKCLDGEGDEKFFETKATLAGKTLDIAVGQNAWRRTVDSKGRFEISVMVPNKRGGDPSHLEGKVAGNAIMLRHIGGRATCSASLAPSGG